MGYISRIGLDIKRFQVERKYRSNKRDANCWLFGEWFGKRCNDNSFFLANYIACHHPEIKIYWVACEDADVSLLDESIKIVGYDDDEALEIFKRAGVVIMNQGFIDFSSKGYNFFRGAVTINLWHGVAWKKIGHDKTKVKGLVHDIHSKVFDYFEKTDKYLSLSHRYTDVLSTAFHANNRSIIEAGYPRNLLFYSSDWLYSNRKSLIRRLTENEQIDKPEKAVIILYMPTFRDNPSNLRSLDTLAEDSSFLEWMENNNVFIIQKAHFVSQQRNDLQVKQISTRIKTINDIAPYEALGGADILITDYSSCFFDYLILDRPIIHYIYDYDNYKSADRGVYYEINDVACGKTALDESELKNAIIKYVENQREDADLRKQRRKQFIEFESAESCETIFNELMQAARSRRLST